MSIFPTRILLATDGSEEAELATLRALDIAERTDSELHVVHVGVVPRFLESYPGTLGYERRIYKQIEEESRQRPRALLAGEARRGHFSRVSPQDGEGGPGDRGFGRRARG